LAAVGGIFIFIVTHQWIKHAFEENLISATTHNKKKKKFELEKFFRRIFDIKNHIFHALNFPCINTFSMRAIFSLKFFLTDLLFRFMQKTLISYKTGGKAFCSPE